MYSFGLFSCSIPYLLHLHKAITFMTQRQQRIDPIKDHETQNSLLNKDALALECKTLGVELIGLTELVNQDGALAHWYSPHVDRLKSWIERGDHGEMTWMESQIEKRCDPRELLPKVRTAITLWLGHHFSEPPKLEDQGNVTRGKVARYAWGRDYHNVLRRVLRQLDKWLKGQDHTIVNHGSVDTSPVLERAIAERCGVGWIGRSTLLVHPKRGTFGSIAILLTSGTFDELNEVHPNRCGHCQDCVQQCPTGAISEEGVNARRCISYWTIEHRGLIPRAFRASIGEWVFGCDICQEVCPWTIKAEKTQDPPHQELWQPLHERARPHLRSWLASDDEFLNESLKGSPLRRAFPHGLKRNAIIVLVNLKDTSALPDIIPCLEHSEPSVRGTAAWALGELGSLSLSTEIKDKCRAALHECQSKEELRSVLGEIEYGLECLS